MDKINIGSMASVIDANSVVWISNVFFNGLFQVDLKNNEIRFVSLFEEVEVSAAGLHRGAHIDETEIIFTPLYDRAVRIYRSDCNIFEKIEIPVKYKAPFSKSIRIGKYIYFLSSNGFVLEYDVKEHVLKEDNLSSECKQFQEKSEGIFFTSIDPEGFSLLRNGGALLFRLDLVKHRTETICISQNPTNFEVGYYGDGLYWFFLKDSQDIVSWDRECEEYRNYKNENGGWARKQIHSYPYGGMLFTEGGIWISNFNARTPVYIDKKKQCIECITDHLKDFRVVVPGGGGAIYIDIHRVGNEICFIPCMGNLLLRYDCSTKELKTIEMTILREQVPYADKVLRENFKKNYLPEGLGLYSFEEFMKVVRNNEIAWIEHKYNNRGRNIWNKICGM